MRALTNLRFAGDKLKKWGVVSEEKKDNWSAYQLTKLGVSQWEILEAFLLGRINKLNGNPFDENYFKSNTFNDFMKSEMISRLIKKMR